jgi:amino acid transporter
MPLFRKKSIDEVVTDEDEIIHSEHPSGLRKILGVRDLTFMGIAAIVGAGIFSTVGTAAYNGGPGIIFLFMITAVTCGFSALCYAEFASRVPISGSAYTYAYVSFGEIVAWIIGWALILEYAIGNIVVAISWSGYFNNLLVGLNIHLPAWLLTDPFSASKGVEAAAKTIQLHQTVTDDMRLAIQAMNSSPSFLGLHFIINIPAFIIVALITVLAYVGIKESKKTTNLMVLFKIAVILLVIALGFFYVKPANWSPFLPKGFTGVLSGVSAVFFAYIGFDAISTTAEECKNPQRDLPKGMIYSLIISTILYILVALVITGMINYNELNVSDPLAFVFKKLNLGWIEYFISISAVVATTSVLLVFQIGQPRIWMSMSRDGLLPPAFARVHKKFHTPAFATIVTGLFVGIPSLILPINLMTDLTSIGTLFAFVLVSFGVLMLPKLTGTDTQKFKLPYINSKYFLPVLWLLFLFAFRHRLLNSFENIANENYQEVLFIVFVLISFVVVIISSIKNYSLIPVLGALSCLYLMIEIPAISWMWFFIWMTAGLIIYFIYGKNHSKLSLHSKKT